MTNSYKQQLLEKVASIVYNTLNEARIQRTIDPKIWATVASGICKKYKHDFGASAKVRGVEPELLQKFVSALIILKQPPLQSDADLLNCKVFPAWAKELANRGITAKDVNALYVQNTDKTFTHTTAPVPVQQEIEKEVEPIIDDAPIQQTTSNKKDFNFNQSDEEAIKELENAEGYIINVILKKIYADGSEPDVTDIESRIIPFEDDTLINIVKDIAGSYMNKRNKLRSGYLTTQYEITGTDPRTNNVINAFITRECKVPVIKRGDSNDADDVNDNLPKWIITYATDDDFDKAAVYAINKETAEMSIKQQIPEITQILSINRARR